jgi:hypothetical protein
VHNEEPAIWIGGPIAEGQDQLIPSSHDCLQQVSVNPIAKPFF